MAGAGRMGWEPCRRIAPHQAVLLPPSQGMSETFETLHNLVHKGVKVVMDIPYELWNETSAEVADLKKQVPQPWDWPSVVALTLQAGVEGGERPGVHCWKQDVGRSLILVLAHTPARV